MRLNEKEPATVGFVIRYAFALGMQIMAFIGIAICSLAEVVNYAQLGVYCLLLIAGLLFELIGTVQRSVSQSISILSGMNAKLVIQVKNTDPLELIKSIATKAHIPDDAEVCVVEDD